MARNYTKEYNDYYGRGKNINATQRRHRREKASRNKIRRIYEKKGKVRPFDGKDIDHINGNALQNNPKNLKVMSASKNRAMNQKQFYIKYES